MDQQTGIKYIKIAAQKENPLVMYHLGSFYNEGKYNFLVDKANAIRLLKKADDTGNSNAINLYAMWIKQKEPRTAQIYLKKAIKLGNTNAVINNGKSLDSPDEANYYFRMALNNTDIRAADLIRPTIKSMCCSIM